MILQLLETVVRGHKEFLIFAVLLIAMAFVLGGITPRRRAKLMNASMLAALSITILFVGSAFIPDPSTLPLINGQPSVSPQERWTLWAAFLICGIAAINVLSVLLFDIVLRRFNLPRILRDLLMALAYIGLGVGLLTRLGVDLTGIVTTSAVITAIIGFSLQDTLINLVGGIALEMEDTVNAGDWIRVDQYEGQIKEIRWRYTSIETRNWDTVVLPNSLLMKSPVTVIGKRAGKPRQHRMWIYFNVDFRFAPTEVIDIVEEALLAEPIENVAADPPPNCIVYDFKDSFTYYAVRYWLTDLQRDDPTSSVVRTRIQAALKRAEIPLSIPAQGLFISSDNARHKSEKYKRELARRIDVLRGVELFHALTDEERTELADRLRVAPFVRGEAITRQGAEAHWLYVITKGAATVRISADDTELTKEIATLSCGDFFGEYAMMTGSPRAATVIAATDVECYRIDKDAFETIIKRRPEIAEDISHVLAVRRIALEAARDGLTETAAKKRLKETQGDLLKRIRGFFGITIRR